MKYKDKLKELEREKKKRQELEQTNQELEESVKLLLEDSEKVRDELKTCIYDNTVFAQNILSAQKQIKLNEPYIAEIEDNNLKLNLEIFQVKEENKYLNDEKTRL